MRVQYMIIALLLTLAASGPSFGQMGGPPPREPMDYKSSLGLSDEQWARLKPLQLEYKKSTIMEEAKIRVAEAELYDLTDNRNFDTAKVEEKLKEIEALKTQLAVTRYESLKKTGAILTDAQYEKLLQMVRMSRGPDAMHRMMPVAEKKGMIKGPPSPINP